MLDPKIHDYAHKDGRLGRKVGTQIGPFTRIMFYPYSYPLVNTILMPKFKQQW